MSHGGRRPGAGAPKGNLNALKTGAYSQQMKAAVGAMLSRDEIRPILQAIIEKRRRERMRYQALMLASAKFAHRPELTQIIVRKMIDFLESDGDPRESKDTGEKRLISIGQSAASMPRAFSPRWGSTSGPAP